LRSGPANQASPAFFVDAKLNQSRFRTFGDALAMKDGMLKKGSCKF